MLRISPHFTYNEFFKNLGDYVPTAKDVINATSLILCVLEPLRYRIGVPIIINSGFRTPEHNEKVGGVPSSQHCYGQAVDFKVDVKSYPKFTPKYLSDVIHYLRLPYDQLIVYDTFLHVSYNPFGNNRFQLLNNNDVKGD